MPTSVVLPAVHTVARVLALGVGALVSVCAVATALFRSGADVPGSAALIGLALDGEFNVPTLVSVLLLAACAGLLAALGTVRRAQGGPYLRHWSALAVIFVAIAADEGLRLHERLNEPMSTLPFTTGYLRWGWVVLGAALVVALAAVYLPFVLHLPRPQRLAAVAAAALFVGGALGLEMVGATAAGTGGTGSLRYIAAAIAEETLEFAGTTVFLVTLYSLLAVWAPVLTVRHPAGADAPPAPDHRLPLVESSTWPQLPRPASGPRSTSSRSRRR